MCCISWDFSSRTTTTLGNLYQPCSYYWATKLLHAACTWILNTDHLVPMKRTPDKAYPKTASTKTCFIWTEQIAFLHRRTIPKASKVLTKSNHFIRHFELFCYYSPGKKKKKKEEKNQRVITKNNLEDDRAQLWKTSTASGFWAHTQVNTISQGKSFDLEGTSWSCSTPWLQREWT